jgi:hypothetical protein
MYCCLPAVVCPQQPGNKAGAIGEAGRALGHTAAGRGRPGGRQGSSHSSKVIHHPEGQWSAQSQHRASTASKHAGAHDSRSCRKCRKPAAGGRGGINFPSLHGMAQAQEFKLVETWTIAGNCPGQAIRLRCAERCCAELCCCAEPGCSACCPESLSTLIL